MNSNPKSLTKEEENLIQEFINQGGTIKKIPYGTLSEEISYTNGFYQKRKKKDDNE